MLAFLKLVLGFKLESRVASALFGPSACQGLVFANEHFNR